MTRKWELNLSEEALAEQVEQAKWAGDEARKGLRGTSAAYDPESNRIIIALTGGLRLAIPVHLLQGLQGATTKQLQDVWIDSAGLSVHWPSLDADFSLEELLNGVYGTKAWMEELESLLQEQCS